MGYSNSGSAHFKANPFWQQQVKTFAKDKAEYYNTIFPKNSPLVPLFQETQAGLMESGTLDYILISWLGRAIPVTTSSDLMILSGGT